MGDGYVAGRGPQAALKHELLHAFSFLIFERTYGELFLDAFEKESWDNEESCKRRAKAKARHFRELFFEWKKGEQGDHKNWYRIFGFSPGNPIEF